LVINDNDSTIDSRKAELERWLEQIEGLADSEMTPASSDASFRRYFRLQTATKSFIAMDAPPPREDCLPFVRIAGYLEAMGLNAPQIVEADLERGFLLLSDLGATQYLQRLNADPAEADTLYADAISALLAMQSRGTAYQAQLPSYDAELLGFELSLFHDWLCGAHLGIRFSKDEEASWQDICSVLMRNALDQPQVFVHRDYHSRNLMVTNDQNPGILDFQDAVEGAFTYDLVSLLKDCYIKWPADQVQAWAEQFYSELDADTRALVGMEQFSRYFELMGVQRQLKAAGIFARLMHRDGKSGYIADIPLCLSYIVEIAPRYGELAFLVDVIESRVLPALEAGT
jgi:aminoglycoside/choline kinase family phosphotransferase